MKTRSNVKSGRMMVQHNETLVGGKATRGLRVKSHVKAGGSKFNHNETLIAA